jgi:hypothetical protein
LLVLNWCLRLVKVTSGKRPSEALRNTQLNSLAEYRKQGKAVPPALWAPFIVQEW